MVLSYSEVNICESNSRKLTVTLVTCHEALFFKNRRRAIQKTEKQKNWPYGWFELLYFQLLFFN